MNIPTKLPERIRQLRLARGLSQENMADMLGLSTTAYGDLERGRTEPTLSRLDEIARLLEVPLPELLGFGQAPLPETEWLRQENQRLHQENAQLRHKLEQWNRKVQEWLGREVVYQVQEHRERIGF